jgi:hypothetical protein
MNYQGEFEDPRVEEALNKVLDSSAFASSKQSQALLKYLVAKSQHQDDGSLKERMIGVNVFGRSHDYNTGDDPIVRARVGEVRKRLAMYYQSELTDEHAVQFTIPTGSYRVNFVYPASQPDTVERGGSGGKIKSVAATESGGLRVVSSFGRWLVVGAVVVGALAGVFYYRQSHRVSNLDMFWSPLLDSPQTVVIYLGQNGAFMPTQRYMRRVREARPFDEDEKRGTDVQLNDLSPGEKLGADDVYVENHDLVSAGNIAASIQIASLLGSRHHNADLRTGDGLSAEDLEHAPAVLLGAFDNRWTMQICEKLPFRFEVLAGETDAIVEQAGQKREWVTHMIDATGAANEEYAIVVRLSSSVYRKPVIIAAGLRSRGTRAAGDFLTDPIELSKFLDTLPAGWKQKNLEVVLRVDIVKGVPGTAQPIAYSVW